MRVAWLIGLLALTASADASAQAHHSVPAGPMAAMSGRPGLGNVHHPVSTRSPAAQRAFDDGLALTYGFNHDEAVRSFQRAGRLDSTLAMAWWGAALALGPNINLPVDADHEKAAAKAIAKAQALAPHASAVERDCIAALATRYSSDPKADFKALDATYRNAMSALVKKYPDDLDLATLYAESIMDLRPWNYWSPDGTPAEGTTELVAVLESVLRRDPAHLGANHLYIHAVEASPHPERALESAHELTGAAPALGHLVHMPSHVYIRTGDYDEAAKLNDTAAEVDRTYIRKEKVEGVYPAMYFNHNLHFSAVSHALGGRYARSIRPARELEKNATPMAAMMPMIEAFVPTPLLIEVRFRRWSDVLKEPQPPATLHIATAIWHFAHGMALAGSGSPDRADSERVAIQESIQGIPADATVGFNPVPAVAAVADAMLGAKIAETRGDRKAAIDLLRQGVKAEDALTYDEPPDWYLHVRESLGGALLRDQQLAAAEQTFRDDLERHPRSGRSLFGLHAALAAEGRTYDAAIVQKEFERAWKTADTKLTVADL
jgi:tetratricopeptide (TPR) repeat protein